MRSPSFAERPEEFLQFLSKLVRDGKYDVLFPTHEQTYLLSRFRDAFAPLVGLAMPPFASLERMQSKAEFSRLLGELDLPQPETKLVRTRSELNQPPRYPFYLKLAHSTAGGGVFYITNQRELEARAEWLQSTGALDGRIDTLLQQPARGVLSTVQAVFNRGNLVGIHCFEARQLGVGGMSTARTSADHGVVREHAERIGNYLNWHGAFFIDYFYDRDTGRPEYIEANPRMGETVNALESGINLPELVVRIARGESPQRAPLGKVGVRTHNGLMILMSLAYEGAARAALARELRALRQGDGLYADGVDELTRPDNDRLSRLPFAWTVAQLMAWPGIARRIVANTVGGYSVPLEATQRIKGLRLDLVE